MDSLEIVRTFHEWQINNLNVEGWAKKLEEELEKIALPYIWQSQAENNVNKICKIIRERFHDIERQNLFSNISEKNSLAFYCEMEHEGVKRATLMNAQERRE
jgi:hypothetical protein